MSLQTLDALGEHGLEEFEGFLAQDELSARKLGRCPATEFQVLQSLGYGKEGLVLECHVPDSSESVALKLFFQGPQPQSTHVDLLWPLRIEAEYYASCVEKRQQYSCASCPVPSVPKVSAHWVRRKHGLNDTDLFDLIQHDLFEASEGYIERSEGLALLEKMCARGWVAFSLDIRHHLRKLVPRDILRFTGNIVIGIVKPFVVKQSLGTVSQERQMQTMLLMKAFGWKLRDFQDRNWIDGYLVDGGDVDISPKYPRYFERHWKSIFLRFIKQMIQENAIYTKDK